MMCLKVLFLILAIVCKINSIELTFELPDTTTQCFYEYVEKDVNTTIEFQVVSGGQLDVDMTLKAPNGRAIHRETRKQYSKYEFTPLTTGIYGLCFSNEFSTFSHKLVYMRFQVGAEDGLLDYLDHLNTMQSLDVVTEHLHAKLNDVAGHQTMYRLREAQGRKRAEELNDRVMLWSMVETLLIIVVVLGEVLVLKNFFPDEKLTLTDLIS